MQLREAVARAIENAQLGYGISLTRLVDGESTYECRVDGMEGVKEFESYADALEFVTERKRRTQADAAIHAMFDHLEGNMSEGMLDAARFEMKPFSAPNNDALIRAFRAMIQQARKEWEDGK